MQSHITKAHTIRIVIAAIGGIHVALLFAWPTWKDTSLGGEMDRCYAQLCHRIADRCWTNLGEPMPTCARCLGIWIGLPLAAGMAAWSRELPKWWTVRAGVIGLVWMFASWLAGYVFLPATWHFERTVAGIIGGAGLYILLTCCMTSLAHWKHSVRRPFVSSWGESDHEVS